MQPDDELRSDAPLVPDLRPAALRTATDEPAPRADQPTTPITDEP